MAEGGSGRGAVFPEKAGISGGKAGSSAAGKAGSSAAAGRIAMAGSMTASAGGGGGGTGITSAGCEISTFAVCGGCVNWGATG